MITYLGDFVEDDVVFMVFNTFDSNNPSVSATITNFINTDVHIHKDDNLTQRNNAAGITVSVDFDGITGSHLIKIDTNDNTVAGFWVAGADYFVRIEGTTVDAGTINAFVGHFSIENRSAIRPKTAGRTLDVSSAGNAGIDWNNVQNPTSVVDLSATDIQLVDTCTVNTDVRGTDSAALASVATEARLAELDGANLPTTTDNIETDTQNIQSRLPAALIGGRMDSDIEAINNNTVAAIQLALSAAEIESGAFEATPTVSTLQTNLAETQDDIYIGRVIIITSGAARGEATDIIDYTGSTGTLEVTDLANAPAATDTFILI